MLEEIGHSCLIYFISDGGNKNHLILSHASVRGCSRYCHDFNCMRTLTNTAHCSDT